MKLKNLNIVALFIAFISPFVLNAQETEIPQNALLKDFRPFETPRTSCRPGTVFRVDTNNVAFNVQDVKAIRTLVSEDGTLIGQMTFTHTEMLQMLNLNFAAEYITAEVEIQYAQREYTEQTNVDYILWEKEKVEELIVDPKSRYYIVRETVSSKNITFRFDYTTVTKLVTGKQILKEKTAKEGQVIDFPFSIQKTFKEPKRIFYLKQEIRIEQYSTD